jgi:hypothetical protein
MGLLLASGLLGTPGVHMVVGYGGVSALAGQILFSMLILKLVWGIASAYGRIFGVVIVL